jgi:TolA-binding protein
MKLADQRLEQQVEAIMEQGRQVRPAPDVVRARLLARARAAVAASRASSTPLPAFSIPAAWPGRRIAVAAAVLLVFVTAGTAAALYSRVMHAPDIAAPLRAPEPPAVRASEPARETMPAPAPAPSMRRQRPHRSIAVAPQESYAAELQLLQRAQSEYASHDFANALVLVAEHGRRFPNGRLAEEREALRVRSLAHADRGDEARRALASFAKRFPNSAFLPRLQEAARSADD